MAGATEGGDEGQKSAVQLNKSSSHLLAPNFLCFPVFLASRRRVDRFEFCSKTEVSMAHYFGMNEAQVRAGSVGAAALRSGGPRRKSKPFRFHPCASSYP